MTTLQINISCGLATCAREKRKFCQFVGSKRFGSIPVCMLFPSGQEAYTELQEFDGWLQRCDDCMKSVK